MNDASPPAAGPAPPRAARRHGLVAASLAGTFRRDADNPLIRLPEVVLDLDARPGPARLAALTAQQVAVQSIYFVLPGLVAGAFGADAAAATNFLCLSLLGVALFAVLQGLTRGIIGSGYPIPAIPSPVLLAAYLLAAQSGATLGEAGALALVTGAAVLMTVPVFRRLSTLIPTEVAGVVVFLIGASLLPVVMSTMELEPDEPLAAVPGALVTLATLAAMVLAAVRRTRIAPFAVLVGMVAGILLALAAGMLPPDAGRMLSDAAWFALPRPVLPEIRPGTPALAGVFMLCLVPIQASLLGNLIAFQRAADADWRRPDPPPLRRGLLAQAVAVMGTGLMGGMVPAVSSAAVGLAIATGTLARRIAIAGAAVLVVLALCPKLATLFILVPDPVQAAMLLYVAGFMMAQGCQMVAARMLDARRTVVAGLGLSSGLAVLIEPAYFAAALPALASPLSLGALVAFVANLLTLPMVARSARLTLPLGAGRSEALEQHWDRLGGGWGLRRTTVEQVRHALIELADLLAGRGLREATLSAWVQEDRLSVTLSFAGPPLPRPATRPPRAEDLADGGMEALEAFAVWLATRHAAGHVQRSTGAGTELRLDFED